MDLHSDHRQDVDADIAKLEAGIKKLRVQYEMFFNGGLPREPVELRFDLERMVRYYRQASVQKYRQRFQLDALISRYNILSERWSRRLRSQEEGRGAGAPRPAAASAPGAVPAPFVARLAAGADATDAPDLRGLYERYLEARRACADAGQDPRPVSYDGFVRGIARQTARLRDGGACGEIELRLAVRDRKIQLTARPVR